MPFRVMTISPARARRCATRRTSGRLRRQSSPANARAASVGQIDFAGPRAAVSERMVSSNVTARSGPLAFVSAPFTTEGRIAARRDPPVSEMSTPNAYGAPQKLTQGPLAGWWTWGLGQDPYESMVGPFAFARDADGRYRAGFVPEPRHLNGAGAIHGGCLMSFADFALFAIANDSFAQGAMAVTLTCNCEFLGAGGLDGLVEATGEVTRETRSLIFVQGKIVQSGAAILAFSGVLKKLNGR